MFVLTLCLQYFKRSSWTLRLPTVLFYIYSSAQYGMYMVIGICTASCRSPTRVVGHKVPMNVFPCLIFHSPPTVMRCLVNGNDDNALIVFGGGNCRITVL